MKTVLSLAAFAFAGLFAVIIRADGWSSPILPCHLPGGTTTLSFDVLPTPIKTDVLGAYSDMAPATLNFRKQMFWIQITRCPAAASFRLGIRVGAGTFGTNGPA